mmetsp:Transcript_44073/g.138501  ORF Transcript_44073/g.138501 Transcript_44073/m.138501 type:complete len:951 (-) Transcript_44073:2260-5112(-)
MPSFSNLSQNLPNRKTLIYTSLKHVALLNKHTPQEYALRHWTFCSSWFSFAPAFSTPLAAPALTRTNNGAYTRPTTHTNTSQCGSPRTPGAGVVSCLVDVSLLAVVGVRLLADVRLLAAVRRQRRLHGGPVVSVGRGLHVRVHAPLKHRGVLAPGAEEPLVVTGEPHARDLGHMAERRRRRLRPGQARVLEEHDAVRVVSDREDVAGVVHGDRLHVVLPPFVRVGVEAQLAFRRRNAPDALHRPAEDARPAIPGHVAQAEGGADLPARRHLPVQDLARGVVAAEHGAVGAEVQRRDDGAVALARREALVTLAHGEQVHAVVAAGDSEYLAVRAVLDVHDSRCALLALPLLRLLLRSLLPLCALLLRRGPLRRARPTREILVRHDLPLAVVGLLVLHHDDVALLRAHGDVLAAGAERDRHRLVAEARGAEESPRVGVPHAHGAVAAAGHEAPHLRVRRDLPAARVVALEQQVRLHARDASVRGDDGAVRLLRRGGLALHVEEAQRVARRAHDEHAPRCVEAERARRPHAHARGRRICHAERLNRQVGALAPRRPERPHDDAAVLGGSGHRALVVVVNEGNVGDRADVDARHARQRLATRLPLARGAVGGLHPDHEVAAAGAREDARLRRDVVRVVLRAVAREGDARDVLDLEATVGPLLPVQAPRARLEHLACSAVRVQEARRRHVLEPPVVLSVLAVLGVDVPVADALHHRGERRRLELLPARQRPQLDVAHAAAHNAVADVVRVVRLVHAEEAERVPGDVVHGGVVAARRAQYRAVAPVVHAHRVIIVVGHREQEVAVGAEVEARDAAAVLAERHLRQHAQARRAGHADADATPGAGVLLGGLRLALPIIVLRHLRRVGARDVEDAHPRDARVLPARDDVQLRVHRNGRDVSVVAEEEALRVRLVVENHDSSGRREHELAGLEPLHVAAVGRARGPVVVAVVAVDVIQR